MPTVAISLSESLKQFLAHEVASKGYGNMSEYVRGLLRQAQARDTDARLKSLQLEGLASGDDLPLTPKFWRELKAEAGQILDQHKKTGKRPTAR
jgi:antitoxin ParD1/3/4